MLCALAAEHDLAPGLSIAFVSGSGTGTGTGPGDWRRRGSHQFTPSGGGFGDTIGARASGQYRSTLVDALLHGFAS